MGMLIKAEFRKILTTRMWWAMMIPAVLLALGWTWLFGSLFTSVTEGLNEGLDELGSDIRVDDLPYASLALTRGMNFATIFPMIFGALAVSSELNRKTITTTFLTAPTRSAVLTAKAVAYVVWGLIYGVVVAGAASIGMVIGAEGDILPEAGDWLLILLTGILACLLWTLLGMGVGALLGSPVAALLILALYAGLVGPITESIIFFTTEGSNISGWMPNGSANGLTGSTAAQLLFQQVQDLLAANGVSDIPQEGVDAFNLFTRYAAGAPGAYSLWISGLIFLGWTALFFGFGMFRNHRRDIT